MHHQRTYSASAPKALRRWQEDLRLIQAPNPTLHKPTRLAATVLDYALSLIFLLISVAAPALAQPELVSGQAVAPTVRLEAQQAFHGADLEGKDGPLAKVGMDLALLYYEHQSFKASGKEGVFRSSNRLAPVTQNATGVDLVTVDAVAAGDTKSLRAALEALGLQDAADFGRIVSGRLPITAIPAMAALPELHFARTAVAMTRAGSTTSQGDFSLRSDEVRASLGFTGAGITVGTLSDSYNCRNGAPSNVTSGDLPTGLGCCERDLVLRLIVRLMRAAP